MQRFFKIFKRKTNVIGMIHLDALPGTPLFKGNWPETIERALYEANIYNKYGLDSILIENMHDVPYVQEKYLQPETVACMSCIAAEVRRAVPLLPCGIQVLACGNKEALAISKACGLQYIRAEGFVYGHVADEGYTNACAGTLLRYRRYIDAYDILIFTDIKKKHSSHAVTQDVSLIETANTAQFFLSDGVIITGAATGDAACPDDLKSLCGKVEIPILIGSGVTRDNIGNYYNRANAVIIGSHFKKKGCWKNELSEKRIEDFMYRLAELREE